MNQAEERAEEGALMIQELNKDPKKEAFCHFHLLFVRLIKQQIHIRLSYSIKWNYERLC